MSFNSWIRVSLFNLLLVAAIGVVLRYKIAFALPFVDQKHLLHGHSHFAFAGWVTQVLMVMMIGWLAARSNKNIIKRYSLVLWANLLTAYSMLIIFPIQGYSLTSIICSQLSVIVFYVFAIMYWTDLNKMVPGIPGAWFKAALIFGALSSLGVYALAAMMVSKNAHQNWHLAAEYFYLHFQYNGWFFFACMGLFTAKIETMVPARVLKKIFWLFTGAFIPAYFLSVLWLHFSLPVYTIIVIAALIQLISWGWLLQSLKNKGLLYKQAFSLTARRLIALSAIALSIKLFLQAGSVIPSLSNISYGFRPIIIGYLHLVLLGVVTLFILGYIVAEKYISISGKAIPGIIIFTSGIVINEILLMTQGVTAMSYNTIPFINEALFLTAVIMFIGLVVLNVSQWGKIESLTGDPTKAVQ